MRNLFPISLVAVTLLLSLEETRSSAATLLISQPSPYDNYGYGLSRFGFMTTALNNSFGSANITVSASPLSNLSYLMSFDALWLTPRGPDIPLTAQEISNVATFFASGRRMVLEGENVNWDRWNSSILQAVGGIFGGFQVGASGDLTTILIHPLTAGVTNFYAGNDGAAIGGTPLFDANVATLWGSSKNALSYLSLDGLSDDYPSYYPMYNSQQAFKVNIANWLAVPVPEPTTVAIITLALLGHFVNRRQISK